ncbi:mechanosensitive ion channel family protein [Oceaniglobus roseus]|uniref:mechanosensitive ion channel family protein n=1 Tax=Oceaniglobus roseus TaxID=1737570 RepID=UPI000C7EACDC|nr:mechanosensitive ion channel family protein [Kandeliimicrobium roseum]
MGRGLFSLAVALGLLLVTLAGAGRGLAQVLPEASTQAPAAPKVALPDPLTPGAVEALVSRLSDTEVRALLLDQLDAKATAAAAPAASGESLGALLGETARKVSEAFVYNLTHLPDFLAAEAEVFRRFNARSGSDGMWELLFAMAAAIAAGLAAERAVGWLLFRKARAHAAPAPTQDLVRTLRRAGARLFFEVVGATIFAATAFVVLHLLKPDEPVPVAARLLFWLVFMPRFAIALLRFFFARTPTQPRLLSVGDRMAGVIYWNFVGIAYGLGLTFAMVTLNRTFGGAAGFWFWFNLVFFGWMALLFWFTRDGWRSIMAGGRVELTGFDAWAVRTYPWLAVFTILATWLFCVSVSVMNIGGVLAGGRHFVSMVIVLVAPLLDTLIHAVVRHFMGDMEGEGPVARAAFAASRRAYIRIGRVLVFGAVLLATARLWHVTPVGMAMAGVGEQLASGAVRVALILVAGYLLWEVVRLAINLRLAKEQSAMPAEAMHGEGEGGTAPAVSRLGTILPSISKALQVVVVSITALMVLSNVGVDVTALLAGAGIVGIAIGFGSQKLVADVISGMFFLIDDAFRLNEYIDTGGQIGTVEKISLRSLRLRDSKGPVLIIPYSNIHTVTNFGRDWGIMKLRFTVPFDTDIEKVRKMFKKIGQELLEDPVLGPGFIEPFKSQGVYEYNDHGIVIRGKFTHKPGKQFEIRKKVYVRVKEEFEKAGIQFARREVRVNLDGRAPEDLSEADRLKISAAAAEHSAEADRALEAANGAAAAPRDDR